MEHLDCVLCRIIAGRLPAKKVYEDDKIIAIHDLSPQAPLHVLVIPKKHIESMNDITEQDAAELGYLLSKIPHIAKVMGIIDYRLVNNCGAAAGQSIMHLHFHMLSGAKLSGEMA